MDKTTQSHTLTHTQTLLSQFIDYCDNSNTQPTSQSLSRFFHSSKSKSMQIKKSKVVITAKKKQVVVIKKANDYIVFTRNCRNNGFCVQEFQGKPAVFSDYINCPDSKLVVYISQTNCTIIKYKFYHIVTPTKTLNGIIIDYEVNPLVDQQLFDYSDESDSEITLNIIQWSFQNKPYLVDIDTQEVFLNNSFVGIRYNQNKQFYIK